MHMQALSGEDKRQVLNSMRPRVTNFCMYSERNSGSNWVASLLKARGCAHAPTAVPHHALTASQCHFRPTFDDLQNEHHRLVVPSRCLAHR